MVAELRSWDCGAKFFQKLRNCGCGSVSFKLRVPTSGCAEPAMSLYSHHVSLVQWTTRLLPVTRDLGSKPLGGLMWNWDSPVSVDLLHWWPQRDWSFLWPRLRQASSTTITRASSRQCDNPRLLSIIRDPGSKPQGVLMWNRDSPVSVSRYSVPLEDAEWTSDICVVYTILNLLYTVPSQQI